MAAAQDNEAAYRQAITEARAGRAAPAAETLRELSARLPARQDILGDYAVVLGWAGDHAAALAQLSRIDRVAAPPYVLEGLAGSARKLKQFELAQALFLQSTAKAPERVEPRIGLALTLADAGRLDEAWVLVADLLAKHPKRIDVLEAHAEVATARGEFFVALTDYQAIHSIEPGHRGAWRGRILTLERMGAPSLAAELADANPGALSASERTSLGAGGTASRIRWGAIAADTGHGTARFAALERALAESEQAGARALDRSAELSAVDRQLALDRVLALTTRFRMRESLALFHALASRAEPVPPYVKAAAATAHLYVEEPERSRDLYRDVLASEPDNVEWGLGLFYALAESEQHAEALNQIDRVVAKTPPHIDAWSPATTRENPAYPRVLTARAMAPLFANRPGEAQLRLADLVARAPYNMDARVSHASSMRARGWPNVAEEEFRWMLAVEPDHSEALGERAGALLEMRAYDAARAALGQAQAIAAENKAVVRAARMIEVHGLRELIVEGTTGRSSGGPTGTRDYVLESRLYSSPFGERYRAFGHLYYAQARFANGTGRRERAGVGLEYRSPRVIASGEVSHGLDNSRTALAASVAYLPNDFWTVRGTLDSSANQTPLQASLAGIDARRAAGEVTWRAHESRAASVSAEHLDFSDGNRRNALQARWTERVITGPVYKLEITAGLYTSRNSLPAAPYFNPARDFSPTLEFANEWLQWRRYTRAFLHRVVVAVGTYAQQGFATGPVANARYEQEWHADDRLTLRYGIGRSLHPYDGVRTTRDYAYFTLNWKF